MAEPSADVKKKKKGRSPSYPGIGLEMAVQRARQLWDKERDHAAPVSAIQVHWGYKPATGPANVTLAALKKYGLLVDEGRGEERIARLTERAVDLLEHPDEDRQGQALRDAALAPPIHRELWEKYGANLPSDANLKWDLTRNRGFTESGAEEFIEVYKQSVAFAGLLAAQEWADPKAGGRVPGSGGEESVAREPAATPVSRPVPPPGQQGELNIPVPVVGGSPIYVSGHFPVSEQAWEQFMAVLRAMKPGLVAQRAGSKPSDEESVADA